MTDKYADILSMHRPVSPRRAHMTPADRAAQFAPFAALTGYEETICETARTTQLPCDLAEDARVLLDAQLQQLQTQIASHPRITVTFFQPDSRKAGGAYIQFTGQLKRMDPLNGQLIFTDGTVLDLENILSITP